MSKLDDILGLLRASKVYDDEHPFGGLVVSDKDKVKKLIKELFLELHTYNLAEFEQEVNDL